MAQHGTVGGLLAGAWRRYVPGGTPVWASHLQPSDIRTWILREVLSWSRSMEARKPMGATTRRLHHEEASGLTTLLDDPGCWEVVRALAERADELAVAIGRTLLAVPEPPAVLPGRVSEKACGIVARHYRENHTVPALDALVREGEAFVADEVERAARRRRFPSAEEFVDRFTHVYDEQWARRGAEALAEARPSELGIGWLERPPMTGRDNGWRAGTDQAVEARYRYHLRVRWATDPGSVGLDLDGYIDSRLVRMESDELGMLVVDRACAPMGLRLAPLRALVRSFAAGVALADLEGVWEGRERARRRSMREWAAATDTLRPDKDEVLVDAVVGEAEWWARRTGDAMELVEAIRRQRPGSNWSEQIQRAGARRLWHEAHTREAQWEAPFTTDEVARLVPRMFRKHLFDLVNHPIPDAPDPGEQDVQRTLEALERNPDAKTAIVRLLQKSDERWRAVYDAITWHLGDNRLRPDDFRELLDPPPEQD